MCKLSIISCAYTLDLAIIFALYLKFQCEDIKQQKISNATKIINSLLYTCTDAKHLQTMLIKLEELTKVIKSALTMHSVPFEVNTAEQAKVHAETCQRECQVVHHWSPTHALSLDERKQISDTNRVGRKAQSFTKYICTSVVIFDLSNL